MHPFAYEAPTTISDAVAVLDKHGDRARPIAGGTDVLVQARANRWDLDAIVDVKNIPELTQISHYPDGSVSIGAATPCYQIYEDQKIRDSFPGIIDAVEMIGGIQIQSRAALGGNLCNASPSADGICPLIAYNAVCHIAGPGGDDNHRDVAVEDFCTGPGSNVLGRGEILVSMVLPAPGDNFGAAYERFIPRNEMDIAVAGAGVSVKTKQRWQHIRGGTRRFGCSGSGSAAGSSCRRRTGRQRGQRRRYRSRGASGWRCCVTDLRHARHH